MRIFRDWFYFSVRNVKRKQIATFNITNVSKGKSLYRDGMTPLVKCTSRPTWQVFAHSRLHLQVANQAEPTMIRAALDPF